MRPKQKYTKSASVDGDVALVKKPRKSKVMNKKECHSLKLQFLLTHQTSWSYIADKFKWRKPLFEKFKQLASSLLGKEKLLNGIVVFYHHCFATLDISVWLYSWWILVIVVLMI